MEITKEQILIKTAKEYFHSAEDEFKRERYNSAVVLYFKSLVSLADLFILQKTGNTPSSHTERFRILKRKFPMVVFMGTKNAPNGSSTALGRPNVSRSTTNIWCGY